MANKYFVWENSFRGQETIRWIELNGHEFYQLVRSENAKGRYFIKLDNDICPDDDVIYIEATQEQYQDWIKEFLHHRYLAKFSIRYEFVPIDVLFQESQLQLIPRPHEDILVDVEQNTENKFVREAIHDAVKKLNDKSREAIVSKYYETVDLSDREIAKKLGIKSKTFEKRRERALEKLRKILEVDVGKTDNNNKY